MAVLVPVAVLIAVARVVGLAIDSPLALGGPPLVGHWELGIGPGALVAATVAIALVAVGPLAARRLPWTALVVGGWASAALFATALAAVDGLDAVTEPLTTGFEYRAILGDIDRAGVGGFIGGFTEALPTYPTHVRGHPVGAPLVFWFHEWVGLTGPGWSAALVIAAGTSTVVSAAVVVRAFAGETAARRAVPFLVVVPAVVFVATSADALFAGVVAASIALFASAAARPGPASDGFAVAAGATGALALHLTYGATLMLVPAAVVVLGRRRIRPLLVGAVGATVVTVGFVAAGFWWFDGLAATRAEYVLGAGGFRPYWYFAFLANPAALIIALGPAVPVALARLRDRRLWLVVGGALAGIVAADLSGLSKGEVERIWLPFLPWLVAATAVFPARSARWWLAAQATAAVGLQFVLESPW